MENKKKLSTGAVVALIAIAVLNILWLIAETILLTQSPSIWIFTLFTYIQFALAAFYAYCGYKKPHGNLMRYLLLFYAVSLGVMLVLRAEIQGTLHNATYIAIIILTTYMAGRLNKYKQNIVICLIVLVLKFVNAYPFISFHINYNGLSFSTFFGTIGPIVVWLAIAAGYIIRYKEHKEAGLADK